MLITATLLGVIVLSMISSFFLYSNISKLQIKHDNVEKILFMRQYQYELLRTTIAFNEAIPSLKAQIGHAGFDDWFNVLWSRTQSINTGIVGSNVLKSGFNYNKLNDALQTIDNTLYKDRNITDDSLKDIQNIFYRLIRDSHLYQQQRDAIYQEVEIEKQKNIFHYYRNSLILSSLTLFFGFIVSSFLYRNTQKLLSMQQQLERMVTKRTLALNDKNVELINEVKERYIVEEQLVKSQSQIEDAKERAVKQLNYDPLTKLASRTLFTDRFNHCLIKAQRTDTKIALLFLDLDRFKHVNDTLGPSVGDELLKKTATRIKDALRQGDTAARFGGDEFAVLLPDISGINHVQIIAQRILKALNTPFILSGHESYISASIGVSLYPADGKTVEQLLRKADNAMYKAKDKGKNTYQFFTHEMEVEANRRRQMETALHAAVKLLDFKLVYQPIINLESGETEGAEALIRWQDKQGQAISPATFIPIAEELGLISKIGSWVLEEACTQAVIWQKACELPLKISVNLSSRQFQNNDLAKLIVNVLAKTGLAPQNLALEITESLLMVDEKQIMQQLKSIRELGVHLAIDDFGTGYSSLSYLKKFPINILKIDRSFIKDLNVDQNDAELVKGILSLAKSLQLSVVAEGVEEKGQLDFLAENGCKHIQGYYFSKPLSSEALITFINAKKAKQLKTAL